MTGFRYGDGMTRDFPAEIRDAISDLRSVRAGYGQRREQLRNSNMYPADRDRRLWELDQEIAQQAPGRIRERTAALRRLREFALEAINEELGRQRPRSWDWAALQFRAGEFKQAIESAPAMGDAFGSESRVALIQRLRNQLVETRDETGLKALRQAAMPSLTPPTLTTTTPGWGRGLDLARAFRADAAAEEGETARFLRGERAVVEGMLDTVESECAQAEAEFMEGGSRLGFERHEQIVLDPGIAFGGE